MPVEVERSFKSSTECWICSKLFAAGNNKVRDHDHVTGTYIQVLIIELVILILS